MAQRSKSKDPATRDIINDLFVHPPVNEVELEQRLRFVDRTAARRLIVDRLQHGILPEQHGPLFLALLSRTGVGAQKRRLTRIALELARDPKERMWAAMALTSEDPQSMDLLVEELGTNEVGSLAELSLHELLAMQGRDGIGESIAMALDALAGESSADDVISRIEACRESIGVSCAAAYGEALARDDLAFARSKLLGLFVKEASEDGIALLERLREKTQNEEARRDFQATLLRVRSRRIAPGENWNPKSGYALVSNCDGQGGFIVLGVVEVAHRSFSVADMCVRAGGDIRDGFLYPRQKGQEVDGFIEKTKRQLGCLFVRVTLAEAAEIICTCADRTKQMGRALPEEARLALTLFERTERGFKWGDAPPCEPRSNVRREEIALLLTRPEYEDSWVFDLGDLGGPSATPPEVGEDLDSWVHRHRKNIDDAAICSRLIEMCEHMAAWHIWNSQPALAALLLGLARDVKQRGLLSDLLTVVLERSAVAMRGLETEPVFHFGSAGDRHYLKHLFFKDVTAPKGRDLAVLDFTEATYSALHSAVDLLPGERRPREDELDLAAFAIGKAFVGQIVAQDGPRPEKAIAAASRALASACRLSEAERHLVLTHVVPSLYTFVEDICAGCQVRCLDALDADCSRVFFTPDHPVRSN